MEIKKGDIIALKDGSKKYLILELQEDGIFVCSKDMETGAYKIEVENIPEEFVLLPDSEVLEFLNEIIDEGWIYEKEKSIVQQSNIRKKQIIEAAKDYIEHCSELDPKVFCAYIDGALWSDENPESKHNLSRPDRIKVYLETILENSEKMTTGNMAHHRAAIKTISKIALNLINETNIT